MYPNLLESFRIFLPMFLFSDLQHAMTTEPFQMLEAFYLLVEAQLQYYTVVLF